MESLTTFLSDFLRGKSIYPPARRFLNVVFSAGIASFIFGRKYGAYSLIDVTDYKAIYSFFVTGRFYIPFFIFAVVHMTMGFLAEVIFNLTTTPLSTKFILRIVNKKINKRAIRATVKRIGKTRLFGERNGVNVPILVRYYALFKSSIKQEELLKAQSVLKEKKMEINKSFKLCIRAIMATTVYYMSLREFSGWLFSISLIFLLLVSIFFAVAYILLHIIPVLLRKVNAVAEEYLTEAERQSSQTSVETT